MTAVLRVKSRKEGLAAGTWASQPPLLGLGGQTLLRRRQRERRKTWREGDAAGTKAGRHRHGQTQMRRAGGSVTAARAEIKDELEQRGVGVRAREAERLNGIGLGGEGRESHPAAIFLGNLNGKLY